MKLCLTFVLLGLCPSIAFAGHCTFEKLKSSNRIGSTGNYRIGNNMSLALENGQDARDYFDGPAWIIVDGAKKCKFEGGIFSGIYLSKSKKLLMTEEYSGSCLENRIVEVDSCKIRPKTAKYCSEGRIEHGKRIVNPPYCEPLDDKGKLAGCSSGHVFKISE
jgi:hypothetical protein